MTEHRGTAETSRALDATRQVVYRTTPSSRARGLLRIGAGSGWIMKDLIACGLGEVRG
jgi:hypothetical protein